MSPQSQTDLLLAAFADELRRRDAEVPDQTTYAFELIRLIESAGATWPRINVPPQTFARYVAERLPPHRDIATGLAEMNGADLYLACGCATGMAAAQATFDQEFASAIEGSLLRFTVSHSLKDDVVQMVRMKLWMSQDGKPPGIVSYSGRGQLRRWVQATAIRTCLSLLRKEQPLVPVAPDKLFAVIPADKADPQLVHLKRHYGEVFRASFEVAVATLSDREQNLLRHHYVDGLNMDEISGLYDVHRTTVYRWIDRARNTLVRRSRREMIKRLSVGRDEIESIMRLVASQIDLSLQRHFAA